MRTYCSDALCVGETVTLCGWVQKVRNLGALIFVDLRDRSGIMQLMIDDSDKDVFEQGEKLKLEYVICVTGIVQKRGGAVNTNLKTGEVEIKVLEIKILNSAEVTPFEIKDDTKTREELRLKFRYLDLRRPSLQNNLILRHNIAKTAREYFYDNAFIEVETPILIKSTPEGARDYLVPSRIHKGSFYALPQSPQLYKQLLMLAGMDRYIQIAKCFRDEDLRADRQPEFTQIDLEMSFVDEEDVIGINEGFLKKLFQLINVDITLPLPRLTYKEAMDRYGSDKPDTRFDMELCDISDIFGKTEFKVFADALQNGGSIRAINAAGCEFSRKELDALAEYVKTYRAKGLMWIVLGDEIKSSISKFLSEEDLQNVIKRTNAKKGDTIFIVADKNKVVYDALGNLRLEVAKRKDIIDKSKYNLVWVTDFPLLEYDEEEGRYFAMHHPFTAPKDESVLDTAPQNSCAKAYDIVINGYEVGGGSIRITNRDLQKKMFKVLGFTDEDAMEKFGYLVDAFKYGAPPHGGMAYGLDRLTMLLSGTDNIRDVIAYPKVQNASELMTAAPTTVDDNQLKELGISLEEEK